MSIFILQKEMKPPVQAMESIEWGYKRRLRIIVLGLYNKDMVLFIGT